MGQRKPHGATSRVKRQEDRAAWIRENIDSVESSVCALNRLSRQGRGSWYDPVITGAVPYKCYLCGDKKAVCLGGACLGNGQAGRSY